MTQMLNLEPSSQLQSLGSRPTPQLLAVKLPSSCAKRTSQSFDQSGANALSLWGLLTERITKTKGFKSRQQGKPNTLPSFLFYPSYFSTISFPLLIKIQGDLDGENRSNVPHPSLRYWPAGDSPSSTLCAAEGGSCTSASSHSHSQGWEIIVTEEKVATENSFISLHIL